MAFGFAGAGAGAAKSLEEIVQERRLRQALEAEIRNQEAVLAERQRSSMADESARTQQLGLQERQLAGTEADRVSRAQAAADAAAQGRTQQRAAGDMAAVAAMPGMTREAKMGEVAGSAARTGMKDVPNYISDLLKPPPEKKYTNPLKLKGGTIQQFEEGQIPPGTQFFDEAPKPDKPTYIQYTDADGKLQVGTPDEIRAQGGVTTQAKTGGLGSAPLKLRAQRTASALNAVEHLKDIMPHRAPGLPGMIQGVGQKVAGMAGGNTQARQYDALLQPTAMQMAVAIQGAANLSDSERTAMANQLGSIASMDYETQVALLDNALEMLRNNADVQQVTTKDPQTGLAKSHWVAAGAGPIQAGQSVDVGAAPEEQEIPGIPGSLARKNAEGKWIRIK